MTLRQKIWGLFPQLWQSIFLIASASWLFAPIMNDVLSKRTTLISEYEISSQPYSIIFRLADIFAGLLILTIAIYINKKAKHVIDSKYALAFIIIGVLSIIDALITTNCLLQSHECIKQITVSSVLHSIESAILALTIFAISCYHALRRKNLVSTIFVIFQLLCAIFSATQLPKTYNFQTLAQYTYQIIVVIWIAWFLGELLQHNIPDRLQTRLSQKYIHKFFAIWAYLNGTLAILISLAHIHIFGFIKNLYFVNNAWIAEHGVIIGVFMLYLSYHLWRGENRARQIFLVLLFIEVIKYSVVTPELVFLIIYWLSFVTLFSLRPYFKRGTAPLDWHSRLQEVGIIFSGVIASFGIVVILMKNNAKFAHVVNRSIHHLSLLPSQHSRLTHAVGHVGHSVILARTFVTLILAMIAFILWSLFRPSGEQQKSSLSEIYEAERLLTKLSNSSEDFFKIWPHDKNYFWNKQRNACIVYKIKGSVVFALADPIAKTTSQAENLLTIFRDYWHQRSYKICFLMISEKSLGLYKKTNFKTIQIGSSAVVDINTFSTETIRNKWWRWQQNQAIKEKYTYKVASPPHSPDLLHHLSNVSLEWLKRPGRREQGFAMGSFTYDYMDFCTIHFIEDTNKQIIAFTNQVPIFNKFNQTTIDLIRFIPNRDHAMPFLLAQTILNNNNYETFDLGFVPLAKTQSSLATITRILGRKRFSIAGLEQFKGKFKPTWVNNYIAYDGDITDLATIGLNLENVMKPTQDK